MTEPVGILLVDDQPERLRTYEVILERLGQRLVSVGSGTEALEQVMKQDFAVVLLDVSMPDMDGFETAALIRQHPRFEETPIIFVTGYRLDEIDRLRAYRVGAVDYVQIPVVPEILRSKVSVFVELHGKRRELQRLNEALAKANAMLAAEKAREMEAINRKLQATNANLARANAVLQDEVSERARLQTSLREANERKDQFLAMLAHELRNPLAPILTAVECMRAQAASPTDLVSCRDIIARQTGRLIRLLDDLLDVSRITLGKINLRKEPVVVATIVARALEITRPLIELRHHGLNVTMPRPSPMVEGDPARLAQALGNILDNAARYTDNGGRIGITVESTPRAEPEGDDVVIRVADTGIGIPAAMLARVFDLFTQVDSSAGRQQGGLGIGLALVRSIVEMHGGTVTAYSDGPGKGTEVVVTLPQIVSAVSPASDLAPAGMPPDAAVVAARRVLVVDDNEDLATSLALMMRLASADVQVAQDGVEALEKADRFRPEIVVADLVMPRLDGYGVARWIRAQPWGADVSLIAVTGSIQETSRRGAHEAGFDAHMIKPVDFDALTSVLTRLRGGPMGRQATATDPF